MTSFEIPCINILESTADSDIRAAPEADDVVLVGGAVTSACSVVSSSASVALISSSLTFTESSVTLGGSWVVVTGTAAAGAGLLVALLVPTWSRTQDN